MPADGLDLDGYLARIGLEPGLPRRTGPTLATLGVLHLAHVAAVPFENLDILLGRPVRLDLDSLQRKIVAARRGGYCFEQNTLFQAVLERIGFRVTPLAARVRAGANGLRPRTHMLLRVHMDEQDFLADVGFGAGGVVQPVPFAEGVVVSTGPFAHRLVREGELWVLQGATGDAVPPGRAGTWSDQYAFTLEPQHAVDYEVANHYTSTHPQSAFVLNLTAQRSRPEGRTVLRNRELTVTTASGHSVAPVRDPEHLLEVLAGHFGLHFPAGTRFSRPEF
jgi:N-hydroxyarylamine O-acetyltransferase